jgi:hypothetical protein
MLGLLITGYGYDIRNRKIVERQSVTQHQQGFPSSGVILCPDQKFS